MRQIVDWLGGDFDGVIVFDESHAMGNAVEMKGKRGRKPVSAQALAGLLLQAALPLARVVYVSATGATEVFIGSDPLAATTAAPTAGQVNVAASGASFQFAPPAGVAGTTLPVRVRVNGIESDPALWVTV